MVIARITVKTRLRLKSGLGLDLGLNRGYLWDEDQGESLVRTRVKV